MLALGKLALMAAPLAWIYRKVQWGLVASHALHFGILPFLGTSALLALSVTVNGLRWHALLRAHEASPLPTRRDLVWYSYVALYLNQLPGGVAGDLVRAHRVRASTGGTATSLAVLMFERVCGLVALFALATAGSVAMPASLGGYIRVSGLVTGAVAVLAIALPWVSGKIAPKLPRFAEPLASLRPPARMRPMLSALLLSFVIHSLTASAIVSFVHAMAPSAALSSVVAVTPLAMLLVFVPLTPGGFGQREAIFVELYGLAGVAANEAVAASLLWFTSSLVAVAIGLGLALVERIQASRR